MMQIGVVKTVLLEINRNIYQTVLPDGTETPPQSSSRHGWMSWWRPAGVEHQMITRWDDVEVETSWNHPHCVRGISWGLICNMSFLMKLALFFGVWGRLAFDTKNTTLCLYIYIYTYMCKYSCIAVGNIHLEGSAGIVPKTHRPIWPRVRPRGASVAFTSGVIRTSTFSLEQLVCCHMDRFTTTIYQYKYD